MNYYDQLKHSFENKINNDIQIFQEKLNDTPKDVDALFGLALIAKNTHQYKLSLEFNKENTLNFMRQSIEHL